MRTMRTMRTMRMLAILAIFVPAVALAEGEDQARPGVEIAERTDDPRLNDMAIAASIVDRDPDNATDSYTADVGSLFCWSSIKNGGEPTRVKHIWRHDDKVVWEMEMEIGKSSRWRTWSKRRISAGATGSWSCEVVDQDGASLGKATVTVQ